jgi:cytochrome P450
MGDSFVFQNGLEWKQHREMVNHAFFDINNYIPEFVKKSEKAVKYVEKMGTSSPVDISKVSQKFTLDVLGSTMFGVEFNFMDEGNYHEYVEAYQ